MIPKKLEPNNHFLGWRSGSGKVGQKCENIPRLWRHPHKTQTRIKKVFFQSTKRLAESAEGLNTPLVLSRGELCWNSSGQYTVFCGL